MDDASPPVNERLVVRMVIDPGEPLSGMLEVSGGTPTAFCGWVELMAEIAGARSRAGGTRTQSGNKRPPGTRPTALS